MTKVIVETDNEWAKHKLQAVIRTEATLLKKMFQKTERKVRTFEQKYGTSDRETLYGQVDDMELVEWEGELETAKKLQARLNEFEEMSIEYR
ncbi:MAG: hypothetical protein GY801_21505 [bacterium]|nr:hypothetical protein [bacterium]